MANPYYNAVKIIEEKGALIIEKASSGGYQVHEMIDKTITYHEAELNELISIMVSTKLPVNTECFYLADKDFASFGIKLKPWVRKSDGATTMIMDGNISAANFRKLVESRTVSLETRFAGKAPLPQLVFRSKNAPKPRTVRKEENRIGK